MLVSRGTPIVNIAKVGARNMVLSFLCLLFFFSFSLWKKNMEGRRLGGLGGPGGVVERWGGRS